VVLARSLVQLEDAVQEAGPQLLFDSLQRRPRYMVMWHALADGIPSVAERVLQPEGIEAQHTVKGQWQHWRLHFLQAVRPLLGCLRSLATMKTAAAAAEPEAEVKGAADAPATVASRATSSCQSPAGPAAEQNGSAPDQGSSSSSSTTGGTGSRSSTGSSSTGSGCGIGSSSSNAEQVKWAYLLQLQQYSPRWTAAAATFDKKWPSFEAMTTCSAVDEEVLSSQRHAQLYTDAVDLCSALIDAAPVTVVCNNLGCKGLADVSEAAAPARLVPAASAATAVLPATRLTGSGTSMHAVSWLQLDLVVHLSSHVPPSRVCCIQTAFGSSSTDFGKATAGNVCCRHDQNISAVEEARTIMKT
jgi:hypothetical protein